MNASFVYAIAGMAAVCTLFGAVRLFGRGPGDTTTAIGHRGSEGVELPVPPGREPEEESPIEIVSRKRFGFGGALVLVRFEGRRILLGVTRGQWTALADLGRTAEQKHPPARAPRGPDAQRTEGLVAKAERSIRFGAGWNLGGSVESAPRF